MEKQTESTKPEDKATNNRRVLTVEPCPCGHSACKSYFLSWSSDGRFSIEEANLILTAVNEYDKLKKEAEMYKKCFELERKTCLETIDETRKEFEKIIVQLRTDKAELIKETNDSAWEFIPQKGTKSHCSAGQIFDGTGRAILMIEPRENEAEANRIGNHVMNMRNRWMECKDENAELKERIEALIDNHGITKAKIEVIALKSEVERLKEQKAKLIKEIAHECSFVGSTANDLRNSIKTILQNSGQ